MSTDTLLDFRKACIEGNRRLQQADANAKQLMTVAVQQRQQDTNTLRQQQQRVLQQADSAVRDLRELCQKADRWMSDLKLQTRPGPAMPSPAGPDMDSLTRHILHCQTEARRVFADMEASARELQELNRNRKWWQFWKYF